MNDTTLTGSTMRYMVWSGYWSIGLCWCLLLCCNTKSLSGLVIIFSSNKQVGTLEMYCRSFNIGRYRSVNITVYQMNCHKIFVGHIKLDNGWISFHIPIVGVLSFPWLVCLIFSVTEFLLFWRRLLLSFGEFGIFRLVRILLMLLG